MFADTPIHCLFKSGRVVLVKQRPDSTFAAGLEPGFELNYKLANADTYKQKVKKEKSATHTTTHTYSNSKIRIK